MQTQKGADDEDKFNLIVGFLDVGTIDNLTNLIGSPLPQDKYAALQNAIVK